MRKFSGLRAGKGFGPRWVIVHDVILHFRHVRKAKLAERALMDDISEWHAISVCELGLGR